MGHAPFDPVAFIRLVEAQGERITLSVLPGPRYGISTWFADEPLEYTESYLEAWRVARLPQNWKALGSYLLEQPEATPMIEGVRPLESLLMKSRLRTDCGARTRHRRARRGGSHFLVLIDPDELLSSGA